MSNVILFTGGQTMPENYPRIQRALGAYRIASELEKHGYSTFVVDYFQYLTSEEIINSISAHLSEETLWVGYSSTFFYAAKPNVWGVERMYQNNPYEKMVKIYEFIKSKSKAKIVFGGAMALHQHKDPLVDYYVAGYAEVPLIEMTQYLDGKIDKISSSKEIDIDGTKSILIDAGSYPEPKMNSIETFWHNDNFNLLPNEAVPLEFARGCIFKCKFCNYPLLGKKKGTYIRDMEQVRDEMVQLWETRGTDTFYITDDTFNDDNDKMEDFHKLFTSLPFKPKFSAFLRLDLIDKFPHQADLLLESGLIGNFFGIETFNHASGRAIGKGLHPDKIKRRLHLVREKWAGKVNTGVGFIIGLPYDDDKYFQELYDYVTSPEYPVQHTVFNALHIFDKSKGVNLYGSEFSLNSEIYGYKFNKDGVWYHEQQNFDFIKCREIANYFSQAVHHKNMAGEFQMITHLNLGIKLEDILTYPLYELHSRYDIVKLNNDKLDQYKRLIGAI